MDSTAPDAASGLRAGWTVSVASRIEDVAAAWLSLELTGIATPYQTLGWQRAAMAALDADAQPRFISIRDRSGRTTAIIPLVLRRRAGVTVASFAGGKHANYNMGLYASETAAALTAKDMRTALADAARQAGIDVFALRSQPANWRGQPNPLALLPRQASPSSAWRADLSADADAFVAATLSSDARKKLRNKERRLAEVGPLNFFQPATPDEARGMLAAFLAQKAARFEAMRISNPFADPAVLRFLDQAAVEPLKDGGVPPVSLFSLAAGPHIVAVFGGVIHGGRFSGMFTSFDADPDIAKYSPGDLLLQGLVKGMCRRGLAEFDLGAGDAAYKTAYCPIEEPLFDSYLPMTIRGAAAAAALSTGQRFKRWAKRGRLLLRSLRRDAGR